MSQKRRIWRLEHPESKKGPFHHRDGAVNRWVSLKYLAYEPRYSEICKLSSKAVFAFDNPFLAFCLMDRPIYFREANFVFVEYEVEKYLHYRDGQVAFVREDATEIKTYSIVEFHDSLEELMEGHSWELECRISKLMPPMKSLQFK